MPENLNYRRPSEEERQRRADKRSAYTDQPQPKRWPVFLALALVFLGVLVAYLRSKS